MSLDSIKCFYCNWRQATSTNHSEDNLDACLLMGTRTNGNFVVCINMKCLNEVWRLALGICTSFTFWSNRFSKNLLFSVLSLKVKKLYSRIILVKISHIIGIIALIYSSYLFLLFIGIYKKNFFIFFCSFNFLIIISWILRCMRSSTWYVNREGRNDSSSLGLYSNDI